MLTRLKSFLVLAPVLLITACTGVGPSQPSATDGAPSQPPASTPAEQPATTDPGVGASPGEPGSACRLLPDADIVELTGLAVSSVEARSAGGIFSNGCFWTLGGESVAGEIILGVFGPGGRAHYDTYIAPHAEANNFEPLEGIGDVGLISTAGSSAVVVVDDVLVDLQWITPSDSDPTVPAALIERVVANLDAD